MRMGRCCATAAAAQRAGLVAQRASGQWGRGMPGQQPMCRRRWLSPAAHSWRMRGERRVAALLLLLLLRCCCCAAYQPKQCLAVHA